MNLKKIVEKALKGQNMTLKELAFYLDISYVNLFRYINGDRRIPADILISIMYLLKISVEDIYSIMNKQKGGK
jgi:transcriptional regulator with XRE-family HTH domain